MPLPEIVFEPSDYEIVHPTHCGDAAYGGQISGVVSSGISPMVYQWSTGDTTGVITDLADGIYHLTVTDLCGINSSEKTYHLGLGAGPDINYEMDCQAEPIGLDHSGQGGNIRQITYNSDQSLLLGIACRGGGFIARTATWRAFDLANDFAK